jgi:tRNA(Ile)-lysidine synthase
MSSVRSPRTCAADERTFLRGAHPERDVERAIERSGVVRNGERVLVACSGGPDSVALAAALHALSKRMNLEVYAGHVNHGVRPSAWQDECVVAQIAAQFEIPLEVVALDGTVGDEQRLRTARYGVLIDVAKRRQCSLVATGHHAEDQTETVILALLRGTGPTGLRGMPERRRLAPSLDLGRPLLRLTSESLRAYCHARALPYAVDPSNAQMSLRRNAVREALAALRPLFPALDAAVARAAQIAGEEASGSRRAVLRASVREQLCPDDLNELDFLHVEEAVRALEMGRTGTFLMKPGLALRIDRGVVTGITRE